jgi:hypothetical protein
MKVTLNLITFAQLVRKWQNDKHAHYLVEGFLHVPIEVPLTSSNQVMITKIQMPRFREGLAIKYL